MAKLLPIPCTSRDTPETGGQISPRKVSKLNTGLDTKYRVCKLTKLKKKLAKCILLKHKKSSDDNQPCRRRHYARQEEVYCSQSRSSYVQKRETCDDA